MVAAARYRSCYDFIMSADPSRASVSTFDDERSERASRIRAMLERWAAEDVREEPDWEIADTAPLSLRDTSGTSVDE